MFNQGGLSLDQAPPLSVVFRFFFSGAIFGIFSGISLFIYQTDIFDPTSVGAVTFTHIITLGVMLSFMFGALFQMLPVIAGVVLSSPIKKANWLHLPLILGILMLLSAFNYHLPFLYLTASIFLGTTLLVIVYIMLQSLVKLQNHSTSTKGMMIALFNLGILVLFALYLTVSLSGYLEGNYFLQVKEAHYSFGLFGWITLLIIAISFQVIEMFYVTPSYPAYMGNYLPSAILLTLSGEFITSIAAPDVSIVFKALVTLELSLYGYFTLLRLSQRKRPVSDATVWFWRIGMGSLLFSMVGVFTGLFLTYQWITALSGIFFTAFALSIVFGMFYKIIPFLTWFHLNSQGYFSAPMMHEIIHPKTAKKHFWLHLMTLVAFLLSMVFPQIIYIAAMLLIFSFGWLVYQLIHAHLLYRKTREEGERFDLDMGN